MRCYLKVSQAMCYWGMVHSDGPPVDRWDRRPGVLGDVESGSIGGWWPIRRQGQSAGDLYLYGPAVQRLRQ